MAKPIVEIFQPVDESGASHDRLRDAGIDLVLPEGTWADRANIPGSVEANFNPGAVVAAGVSSRSNLLTAKTLDGSPDLRMVVYYTVGYDNVDFDAAIERGKAYREAGASVIFVEAPESEAEMKRITSEIPGLKTVNNIEGGKTPILPLERAHELGFVSVGFVLTGLYAAAKALRDAYAHLLEHGSSAGLEASMMRFDEFGELLGLEEKYALDEKFGAD